MGRQKTPTLRSAVVNTFDWCSENSRVLSYVSSWFIYLLILSYVLAIGVRGGGSGGSRPPVLKIFRENSVFRASASCSKFLNDKKYIFNRENSGQTLFSGQTQVAQKSWMIKNVSTQWKFSGQLCFSGQAQVTQKSWMIKKIYIQTSENFHGKLCFSVQAQIVQNSWM